MAWIESHDELPTHPKTLKAARKLKVGVPTVIGHLHMLWYWCLTHRPDGRLDDMDADDVADAAGWADEGETFVKALLAAGWLDDNDGTLSVHDWWDGAGKTIKRRKYATERQRRARDSQTDDTEVENESHDSHTDVTRDTHASHGADSDSDSDKGQKLPPGDGKPFVKVLADELRTEHGCDFPKRDTLHQSFKELLSRSLECLPEERHRDVTMGVIANFVEQVQDYALTKEARSHTARLVSTFGKLDVLDAYGEAMNWGAGIGGKHGEDPLSLSKYVAAILGKRKAAA